MAKEQKKEAVLKIDEKEYLVDDLSQEQKVMVDHIADLDRKISTSTFNLQQLQFGKQAFVDGLKASLEKDSEAEK